jgi:hypothetical protein
MPPTGQTSAPHSWWVLTCCLLLSACASSSGRSHGRYALDTATNACRQNPANCAALLGREAALKPVQAVATIGTTVHAALQVLDAKTKADVEEALKDCADLARTEVLDRHRGDFAGPIPTEAECKQWVLDKAGKSVTWAMLLGEEMHQVALQCAQGRLDTLRPGGYSLEPCYRYNRPARQISLVPAEERLALLCDGRGSELRGTLRPDVVLHTGDPLQVQAVFDFKFPCVNSGGPPRWNTYPRGHAYDGETQGDLYKEALGPEPRRIVPRWGVLQ